MGLTPRGNSGGGNAITEKAFIDEVKVINTTDVSKQDPFPRDIALELEMEGDGLNFTMKHTIGGDFKRDANSKVSGWGGAFPIDLLAEELGLYADKDAAETHMQAFETGIIPQVMLTRLQGKTIYKVSYACGLKDTGKIKYRNFNIVSLDKDKLMKSWTDSVAKGYPKNYTPDVVAETDDTTPLSNEKLPDFDDLPI